MYYSERTAADWRAFWQRIARELGARGVAAPEHLSMPGDLLSHWAAPELVLSQTCAKPFRDSLRGKVQVVGAFDFGLEGCAPGHYRSALVARRGDGRDLEALVAEGRLAINGLCSQSGAVVLRRLGADLKEARVTGAHWHSLCAVASGKADLAAIDAQTWRLAVHHEEVALQVEVLDWTKPTPGLPLITALGQPVAPIREALDAAISTLPRDLAARLGIIGWVPLDEAVYADGSAF